jgi:hypothetical protein
MGVLYDHSLVTLVVFGMLAQATAAIFFLTLRAPLAAQRAQGH